MKTETDDSSHAVEPAQYMGLKGFARIYRATMNSMAGLKAALKFEAAFREEVIIAVVMVPAAFFIGDSAIEVSLLLGSLLLVMIVELLNSAIESLVDRISLEHHELSGRIKDMGSAAVLLALITVLVVWSLILFEN